MPELNPKLTEDYELGYRDGIRRMVRWMRETADKMEKDDLVGIFSPRQPKVAVLRARNLREHAKDFEQFAQEASPEELFKA